MKRKRGEAEWGGSRGLLTFIKMPLCWFLCVLSYTQLIKSIKHTLVLQPGALLRLLIKASVSAWSLLLWPHMNSSFHSSPASRHQSNFSWYISVRIQVSAALLLFSVTGLWKDQVALLSSSSSVISAPDFTGVSTSCFRFLSCEILWILLKCFQKIQVNYSEVVIFSLFLTGQQSSC